jgi:hypothetical protein
MSPTAQMNTCTLHDDGEIRLKSGAAVLSRITSRVADNPGLEQLVVTRIVCVTVDPQFRPITFNHTPAGSRMPGSGDRSRSAERLTSTPRVKSNVVAITTRLVHQRAAGGQASLVFENEKE